METAGDKQIQKGGVNGGGDFHLWVINVGGVNVKEEIRFSR